MSNHFRNKSCSWWRSIFNDLFRFSITTSNKLNFTFLCCLRFSFSNQIIFKQHLVIIINEYKFPLLTYSLEYFILYINPILDGSFILVFPKGVCEALKNSNWFWSFWLRYATDHFIFGYFLVLLTMGYFRFPLGWVPFSSACFFSATPYDLVFLCNTKYIELCSSLSYVKTNILFLSGVYSIFRSHLSVTDLSFSWI